MTERDPVRDYVRRRMAGDPPPDFVGSVMNDVDRTGQRRGATAWWAPLAAVATVLAAVVAVVVGLGLLNGTGVGDSPSSPPSVSAGESESASASPSASESGSPSASASASESSSPSADPTAAEGEFGPVWSMDPDEAFGEEAQRCRAENVISNAEPSEISYEISFPSDWFTNPDGEHRSPCTVWAPEAFVFGPDDTLPPSVKITLDVPPGGPLAFSGGASASGEEYTVDGVAAVRYEIRSGEGDTAPVEGVLWVIAAEGRLPEVGNDRPYIAIGTRETDDAASRARWIEVLDRMVATLRLAD